MDHLISLLMPYRYWILFPLAVIEGPILAVIAGFLCMGGYFNVFVIFPIIIAGDLTGDSLTYFFGRFGWPPFLKKLAGLIGVDQARIERAKKFFADNPGKIVSLSKVTLGIGFVGIYLAGRMRIPFIRFIRVCLLTSIVQYILYLSVGLLFGSAYTQISRYLNFFAAFAIVVAAAAGILFFIQQKRKKI